MMDKIYKYKEQRMKIYIFFLLLTLLTSCATYDPSTEVPAQQGGGGYNSFVASNNITNLFLMMEYKYNLKEYAQVLNIIDKYNSNDNIENIFINNVRCHIITFDAPDIDQSITANEELYYMVDEHIYNNGPAFDTLLTEKVYVRATGRVLTTMVMPLALVLGPLQIAAGNDNAKETLSMGWNNMTKGYTENGKKEWPQSKFKSIFVDIFAKEVKRQSAIRLARLYGGIAEYDEEDKWRAISKELL